MVEFNIWRQIHLDRTANEWPPHSPDLKILDCFLWGHLKERMYTPSPQSTDELKRAIKRDMGKITPETCRRVIDNFKRRLDVVITQNGRHIEHIL